MSPREILQFNALMNEGAVDRALVMKGEFAKECKELQSLITEWDKRGKIDARLHDLAAQTKAFQEETEAFDKTVAAHAAKVEKLKKREDACATREAALTAKEAETIKGSAELVAAKDKHDEQVKADTDAMARARADVASAQADISAQRKEIAMKEADIADRLAKLRAIAG
jgi:chromosome segregation ATPase